MMDPAAKFFSFDRFLRLAFIGVAIVGVLLYYQLFSMTLSALPIPDEIAGWSIFITNGFFRGIKYYWLNFIGRPAALGWFGFQITLSNWLGIWPWHGVVAAKALNFVAALACLTTLIQVVLPRLPVALSLAIAALLLSTSLAGPGLYQTLIYFLFDMSIYLFSFTTYCLVLCLFWRMAQKGIDRHATWLPLAFFLYVGTQEVNLIPGGLMLALFALCLLASGYFRFAPEHRAGSRASGTLESRASRRRSGRAHLLARLAPRTSRGQLLALFLVLCLVYIATAYFQLASPSLVSRYKLWPAVMGWREAAESGLPASITPLLELALGIKGAVLPTLLSGVVLGAWHGFVDTRDRRLSWLLLSPLVIALVLCPVIGILTTRYGLSGVWSGWSLEEKLLLIPKERNGIATRYIIYMYQLWYIGLFFGSVLLGMWAGHRLGVQRQARALALVGLFAMVWLAGASMASSAFAVSFRFNWLEKLERAATLLRPLREPPGFDGTRYLEEPQTDLIYPFFNESGSHGPWIPAWVGAVPRNGNYPLNIALQGMFRGAPIMFVPCEIAKAPDECQDPETPRVERRLDNATAAFAEARSVARGGAVSTGATLVFTEDASEGEHYLATAELAKSARTLVQVTAIVDASKLPPGRGLSFHLVSPDGSAFVEYDPARAQIVRYGESGARALDGSIRRLSSGASGGPRIELTARFVVVGPNDRLQFRFGGTRDGRTSYQGDGNSGWAIERMTIRLLDTGEATARLQPAPGRPARLYLGVE